MGVAGIVSSQRLSQALVLVGIILLSIILIYAYWTGRPFSIRISCTPTHLVNGERRPDKPSEERDNILIQSDSTKVHGEIELTRFNSNFDIHFDSSSEINVELESIPRQEHSYDPEENRLTCANITDHRFPIKLDIYPSRNVKSAGRYHSLTIEDNKTGSILFSSEVIDVRS